MIAGRWRHYCRPYPIKAIRTDSPITLPRPDTASAIIPAAVHQPVEERTNGSLRAENIAARSQMRVQRTWSPSTVRRGKHRAFKELGGTNGAGLMVG